MVIRKRAYMTVPNALSISRIVFLPLLFLFAQFDMRLSFLIGYILVGSTDFFDGLIARRFNQKTEIGKALDSIADLFFYIATAYFLYKLFPDIIVANSVFLTIFFILLGVSFVISAITCKKPILMHTFLLKLNAVLIYALVILSFFFDTTYVVTLILCIYYIGLAEEIWIFIQYGEVDPDTPSVFSLKSNKTS